jgi:hypothetical protein
MIFPKRSGLQHMIYRPVEAPSRPLKDPLNVLTNYNVSKLLLSDATLANVDAAFC